MSSGPHFTADPLGVKLGLFWLAPGISRRNALTLLFSGFSLVCLLTFMAFVQPYLLQEVLHVPEAEQGSLIGFLQSLQEVVFIVLVSFAGALSDKHGRRIIYVLGLVLLAAAFVVYPLATTATQLVLYRVFYAVGVAAASVMMHTCLAEYSQEVTRGKWLGLVGACNGSGVVLMALVLAKLPAWYQTLGFDTVQSIRLSFWTFAGYLLLLAALLRIGLAPPSTQVRRSEGIVKIAGQGVAAARANPRIMLAYGMAFASRGDLAILTSFFSLWVVQEGAAMGWTTAESIARGGMLFGLSQLVGLLWAYPMGMIIDRLNRMTGMAVAFGLAVIGYGYLGQIDVPVGAPVLLACVLVGMGEASALVAGGVMIGQEAPAVARGAVLGTFGLMGALGIMVLSFAGGLVFDGLGRTAPFTMMAFINLTVLVAVLWFRYQPVRGQVYAD